MGAATKISIVIMDEVVFPAGFMPVMLLVLEANAKTQL